MVLVAWRRESLNILSWISKRFQDFGMSESPSRGEKTTETSDPEPNVYTGYDSISQSILDSLKIGRERLAKYQDFDVMDEEIPEISAALDIYTNNVVYGQEIGETYKVVIEDAPSDAIKTKAQQMVDRTDRLTGIREDTPKIVRGLVKYGVDFQEIVVANKTVWWLKFIPADQMVKNYDIRRRLEEYAYTQKDLSLDTAVAKFREWQIAEYSINMNRKTGYGVSVLNAARKAWKQLNALENSLIIGRIRRAQMRLAWLIDVGNMQGNAALAYIDKLKKKYRKKRVLDPSTGMLKQQMSPLTDDEDLFVPVREGAKHQGIQVIQGDNNTGEIRDVRYFHNKMLAGPKVPSALLGFAGDINSKSTLVEQLGEFAKAIRNVQLATSIGHKKVYSIQFILAGINPSELKWSVVFPPMGTVGELRKYQTERLRAQIIKEFNPDFYIPTEWIYRHILRLSEESIKEIAKYDKAEEKKRDERDKRDSGKVKTTDIDREPTAGSRDMNVDARDSRGKDRKSSNPEVSQEDLARRILQSKDCQLLSEDIGTLIDERLEWERVKNL